MAGCTPARPDQIPLDEARTQVEDMRPQLQDAMARGIEVSWAVDEERTRLDGEGVCRWSPGDSSAELTLPEDDAEAWSARRDGINEVLAENDFDEVGDAGRRNGAPAYGFFSDREDGAGVHVYTVAGTTVVRVFGLPVEDADCA